MRSKKNFFLLIVLSLFSLAWTPCSFAVAQWADRTWPVRDTYYDDHYVNSGLTGVIMFLVMMIVGAAIIASAWITFRDGD